MNPYESLPPSAFWRSAVAEKHMFDIGGLWQPRFEINPQKCIATFVSCFAQHFGKALLARDYSWQNMEAAPDAASEETRARFSYVQFSARTGNIYTTSLLRQWLRWASDDLPQPSEFWAQDGRIFDPFRPMIEPNGFESLDEMRASRTKAIAAMGRAVRESEIVVFTLGLAESWHRAGGDVEYPLCPGTAAGTFDANAYEFRDQSFEDVWNGLRRSISIMRKMRPGLKVLLTVSPVALTATNSGSHVMLATSTAKANLRAAADMAKRKFEWVDYFPSYEIITQPAFRGVFYAPNMRSVTAAGVDFVMRQFFAAIGADVAAQPQGPLSIAPTDDPACEEEILATFGR